MTSLSVHDNNYVILKIYLVSMVCGLNRRHPWFSLRLMISNQEKMYFVMLIVMLIDPYMMWFISTHSYIFLILSSLFKFHCHYVFLQNSLHFWCVLNLKSIGCRWRLFPCFARAGHTCSGSTMSQVVYEGKNDPG